MVALLPKAHPCCSCTAAGTLIIVMLVVRYCRNFISSQMHRLFSSCFVFTLDGCNPFSGTHPHTKWYESVGGGKGKFEWGCITGSVEKSISAIVLDALRVSFHHPLSTPPPPPLQSIHLSIRQQQQTQKKRLRVWVLLYCTQCTLWWGGWG